MQKNIPASLRAFPSLPTLSWYAGTKKQTVNENGYIFEGILF